MLLQSERQQVADYARRMIDTGLVVNTSGNISIRVDDQVAITPSGYPYDSLRASDIVVVDLSGEVIDGDLLPSSETPLHLSLYADDSTLGAIVHTHSVYATAVSTLVDELPAIHYQIESLGGPVPVAPYRTFGSPELASVVAKAIKGRSAALMQNHGSTTVGETVDEAFSKAVTLEWLARVYLEASRAGSPSLLSDLELAEVRKQLDAFAAKRNEKLRERK
jgi:L-fuculose-phosphate aldolase